MRKALLKKLFTKSIKTVWAIFATTVVLLAVVISLLKVFLPYADNYKQDIESYIVTEFNANVTIGSIGASWQKFGPAIVLNDVELAASEDAPLDIKIAETKMNIDFWRSLREQRLVTGAFLLKGVETKINSDVFFKVRPQSQGSQLFEGLSHLFLSQVQQFSVIDSQVLVRHQNGQLQTYHIDDLAWVNEGNHHRGQGEMYIDGFSNNSLGFRMELYGQRRSEIFGQIYIEAQQVDITPWLTQFIGEHVAVKSTEANFQVWSDVKDGLVGAFLVDLQNTGVRWEKQNSDKFLFIDSAKLQWQKQQSAWQLFGSGIDLTTEETNPTPFDLLLARTDKGVELQTEGVDVFALAQLLSLFSVTKDTTLLANADISGTVNNLAMLWPDQGELSASLSIDDFSYLPEVTANEAYLGFEGTDVDITWSGLQGWVELRGSNGEFTTADTFETPFAYDGLLVDVAIDLEGTASVITLDKIEVTNPDLHILGHAQVASIDSESHLSVYAEVVGPRQGKIVDYLPRHLIGPNTHSYLSKAIKSGEGLLTRVIIDGPTNQVPFDDSAGTFLIEAQLANGEFEFDSDWPAIKDMNATLTVNKMLMGISAHSGTIANLPINNDVYAELDLGAPNTLLELSIEPDELAFEQFHHLVETTPLDELLGDVFDFVNLSGQGAVQVDLSLPLDDELDANGNMPQTVARGTVRTNNAGLSLPELNLDLANVDAFVSFENEAFAIHSANATWNNLPINMLVAGNENEAGDDKDYVINAQVSGSWQGQTIKKQLPTSLQSYYDGPMASELTVNVSLNEEGYEYDVASSSNLKDAEYKITGPLVKGKGVSSELNVSVFGNQNTNNLYIELDDLAHFMGEIPASSGVVERAILSIKKQSENANAMISGLLPQDGFEILVDLPGAEFEPTLSFVLDILDTIDAGEEDQEPTPSLASLSGSPSNGVDSSGLDLNGRFPQSLESDDDEVSMLSAPSTIKGKFGYIDILGQRWHNTTLNAEPKGNGWRFDITSDEADLSTFVYDDIEINGIDINAKRLNIKTEPSANEGTNSITNTSSSNSASDPGLINTTKPAADEDRLTDSAGLISGLPDLHFECEVCTFNNKPLGKLVIDTFSRDSSLFIERASLLYQRNEIRLTGIWAGDEGAGKTNLSGDIYSRYFGQWMLDWELNTGIKQSDLHSKFSLSWDGAPHEFGFSTLNGDTTFKLGEGYLSEVSDKGARIFSLFSLNSLYRKLKFDFNDVFQKGLFYNDIKGSMQIENGVVYSEDIFMDGVAGNMNMRGFTNLNSNALNYDVTFKPKITSSIPVIAAWLAPGTAGLSFLAGIAIDKIIEKADVVSEVRLKITGDLAEPKVQEVKRFTKTIDIPGAKEAKEKAEQEQQKEQQKLQQELEQELRQEQLQRKQPSTSDGSPSVSIH